MNFDEIIVKGEQGLLDMVATAQPETLHLEFKAEGHGANGLPWIRNGRLTEEIKKVLAKALSGMANSAGGVLLLGIEARRDAATGIDGAVRVIPFDNVALLTSLVTQAASDLLQPKHDGIRVGTIPSATAGHGYVVLDIPRSERRPHRSEAKDQKQYFKRAAGSTFAMEHYDIEDAFRRTSTPDLMLELRFAGGIRMGTYQELEVLIHLVLVNTSDVTAKHPSMRIQRHSKIIAGSKYGGPKQSTDSDGPDLTISSGADFFIHPGERRLLERLSFRVNGSANRLTTFADGSELEDIKLDYRIYAENMRVRTGTLELLVDEVIALLYR